MKIIHFCAGLEGNNGMANTARQFVAEDRARGDESKLSNELSAIEHGIDRVMIHGAWLPVLWRAAKRAKTVGAELVIRPAGSYDPVRLAFHGWKKRLVVFFEHRMLRRADMVLATCEAEREWILAYEPKVKRTEITDLKRFFKLNALARVHGDLGVEGLGLGFGPAAELRVLYLGRRHPLKGVEYLERAVAELGEAGGRPMELRIVSGHFGEELERDWKWCEVLVLPTLSENFGRVVAEALERGKYVITTDGAPAWEPPPQQTPKSRDVAPHLSIPPADEQWRDRLFYLRGYREGTAEERVRLLKEALSKFAR